MGLGSHASQWLACYFEDKRCKNQRLSLRMFSRKLGVSPATLSQVLNGKRQLTRPTAEKIAARLNLTPEQKHEFLQDGKLGELAEADDFAVLEMDSFRLISDWYHYAILSVLELEGVDLSNDGISLRLGITKRQTKDAIARLTRLGIVAPVDGKLKQVSEPLSTKDALAEPAIRSYVTQYLERAHQALDANPSETMDYSTMVMAIDARDIPEAKLEIKRFRRRLCKKLESGRKRRVYAFSCQLFPIDTEE